MALCRCLQYHAWPRGRTTSYVAYVHPMGYPNTALICGLSDCKNPGVIWLDGDEAEVYENGRRIFEGPSYFAKMRADDDGLHKERDTARP